MRTAAPAPIDATRPHIPFQPHGSYPVRAGNLVRPLIDGEPAFRRICEAVEAARRSVWLTVTFLHETFRMPDGRGSLFDVLDRAAARGLDVRMLIWRCDPASIFTDYAVFPGTPAQRDMLRKRGTRFRIRWDRTEGRVCHHQKCWLVDAGQPTETAFVGGINPNPKAMVPPGHAGRDHIHDMYVEVAGPAATDVHHNFVQRWNEASERHAADGVWAHDGRDDLPFPARLSAARGDSQVQIQRHIPAGLYADGRAAPDTAPFAVAGGEWTIVAQYVVAIGAARRSIYIENQAIAELEIVEALDAALARGVDVTMLLPAEPEALVRLDRAKPERQDFYDRLAGLARHDRFLLSGIAGVDGDGARHHVYVHAKAMLVDDAWATIGSCNLHTGSLRRNAELNASFWAPEVVRALRRALFAEHLDADTDGLDDRAAHALFRRVARDNRRRRDADDPHWQGLAFSLDPATYGA